MIEFNHGEIRRMSDNPDILRAVANQHDCLSAEAESVDNWLYAGAVNFHTNRAKELRAEADRLDELYGC